MNQPREREEYLANGFLVFDPGIDARTLDGAVEALAPLYLGDGDPPDRTGRPVAYRDARRIQDAWKVVPEVKAIATAPRVMELLRDLHGRTPRPFQTLNFRVGSEQQPHSDTIHFNSKPAGFMCGVWVALEDVDMASGPVAYFPGSHLWKELALPEVDAFTGRSAAPSWRRLVRHLAGLPRDAEADYAAYERLVATHIRRSGVQPAYATLRKGQALAWAANLVHGGSPRTDPARTRASQVTHFFFEGCRYYTPLLQRGWKTHWRRPAWIL